MPRFRRFQLSMRHKVLRYAVEKWCWVAFVPVAYITGLVNSVAVVSVLSIYALVITAGGAQQAAKAALEASSEAEESDAPAGVAARSAVPGGGRTRNPHHH